MSWRRDGVKYGFPRVAASCDYKKPARFEDVLTIAVSVENVGTKAVTYRFEFSKDGETIAVGRITGVFCRSDRPGEMTSLDIPADVRAKIES